MRLPEKLMGYVEYEGVNYPFNFDKDSFVITLFPPSIEYHRRMLQGIGKSTNGFNKENYWGKRQKITILFSTLRMQSVIITAFSAFLLFGIAAMLVRTL